jgi:hypothetical protein
LRRSALVHAGYLVELAGFYVVDEAAHRDLLKVRMRIDAGDLLADVGLEIREGVEMRGRNGCAAGFFLEGMQQVMIFEGQHAAIGVVDNDEFLGAEQMMGNDERAQSVFAGDATGVADDVGFADFEPEDLLDGEARVHAGQHRELTVGAQGGGAWIEGRSVFLIRAQNFVGNAHE